MGLAELIPGISGATIALLFGIYKNLISILSNIKLSKKIFSKEYFVNDLQISLMVFLIFSMIAAILLFSNLIHYLIESHSSEFFKILSVIMVLVSLRIFLFHPVSERSHKRLLFVIAGGLIGYLLSLFSVNFEEFIFFLFIGGFIAFTFFIIPGISGSAILLSIGLYETVISSIATFEVLNLLVFGLGCAASLILMPKLIKKIYEQNSLAMDTFFAGLIFISGIFLW